MSYNRLVASLTNARDNDYLAFNPVRNPVVLGLATAKPEQLLYQLTQYAHSLPRHIIYLLGAARLNAKLAGWKSVALELEDNINQELGALTDGIPHYELLVKGMEECFDIDISSEGLSPASRGFISTVQNATRSHAPEHSTGAAYALENTAIPELRIVRNVADTLRSRQKSVRSNEILGNFFADHIDNWEKGHEEGLRTSSSKYVKTPDQFNLFEAGFRGVMEAMDTWWTEMYEESRLL